MNEEQAEKERLLAAIREKMRKRNEERVRQGIPQKVEPKDSTAADLTSFGLITVFAVIGFAIMAGIVIKERPAALLPLAVISLVVGAGLEILGRMVFKSDQRLYERKVARGLVTIGGWLAIVLGAGTLFIFLAFLLKH